MINKKNKKILISGATGFLGQSLLQRKKELRVEIYPTASAKRFCKGSLINKMDLTNFKEAKRIVERFKPDIVYHLGALVDLSRNFAIAQKCIEINIKGTLNLLESLRSVNLKNFIFVSTEEVYGGGPLPFKETQKLLPPSPYAISKVAGENLVKLYAEELKFNFLILRIGTMYGPNLPEKRFISKIIIKALKNEDIPLTSGKKKRDYVFVDDVVDALILAKDILLKKENKTLNIGSGLSCSLKDLVFEVLRLIGSNSKILLAKIPERLFEADKWLMDIRNAKKVLGWEPKTSLGKGLEKTIEFFRRNLI